MLPQTTSTSCSSGSLAWARATCAASGLEQRPLGRIDLRDWSGLLLGGGPFNSSDPETAKSPVQRRVEADLRGLLDQVISEDFPFLGACYGIGTIGAHQGAVVDRRFAEQVGAAWVTLTPQGQQDPLLRGLPATFEAFTGHKEAISHLPRHAVLLATSPGCPGPGVPDRLGCLRHPVPSRAGPRRPVYPHRGLQARRVLPARAGGRDRGPGPPAAMSSTRTSCCAASSGPTPATVRPYRAPGRTRPVLPSASVASGRSPGPAGALSRPAPAPWAPRPAGRR